MKRKIHIAMSDDTHRKLKALAGITGLTIGGTIEALLDRVEERGSSIQKIFQDAGLADSYTNQPLASLGLTKAATIRDMIEKADVLRKPPENRWEPPEEW